MTTSESVTTRRPYRGIGAVLVMVACVAACALPVVSGLIAGTFVDRWLDVPTWAVVLVAAAVGATAVLALRRRRASRGR